MTTTLTPRSPRCRSAQGLVIFLAILTMPFDAAAWWIEADFEEGSLGAVAEGSDAFHGTANHSYYSSEFVHSGSQSAQLNISAGDTGFGRWGGSINHPDLGEGEELWFRLWAYFPDDFDFSCGCTQGVKFMRIHTEGADGSSQGYHSILINGDIETGTEVNGDEFRENNGSRSEGNRRSGIRVERGRWQAFEIHVRFSATPGNGIYRVWQDGLLVFEDLETATLRAASSRGDFLYLFTYWNNGSPRTQSAYLDDIVVTNETPQARDADGNAFIGNGVPTTPDGGTAPPDAGGGYSDAGALYPDAGVDQVGSPVDPPQTDEEDPLAPSERAGCNAAGAPVAWFNLALVALFAMALRLRRRTSARMSD